MIVKAATISTLRRWPSRSERMAMGMVQSMLEAWNAASTPSSGSRPADGAAQVER